MENAGIGAGQPEAAGPVSDDVVRAIKQLAAVQDVEDALLDLYAESLDLYAKSDRQAWAGYSITDVVAALRGRLRRLRTGEISAVMKRLDAIDKNTSETKGMVGQLLMAKVQEYVDASSTGTETSQQKTFKAAVAAHYGYEDVDDRTKQQVCMVTGRSVDFHDMVAGHIIPRTAARSARIDVRLADVNDPRNGIFWSRPMEAAWSSGIFCFSSPGPDFYKFVLLDNSFYYKRVKDWDFTIKLKGVSGDALGDLTWGELHEAGKLNFLPASNGRPFKRALSHQAKMFLINARTAGWTLPVGVDPYADHFDYMSDDAAIERTTAWVKAAANAL